MPHGVPQGSVLGPLLFTCILYTTPLSHLIDSLSADHQMYADDTQLLTSFTPQSFHSSISDLQNIIFTISSWMTNNKLLINQSKTDILLVGSQKQLAKVNNPIIRLSPSVEIEPLNSVRNLGFYFDSTLSLDSHITNLSKSCNFLIRDLRRLRPSLNTKTAATIATSIVHSKLDYCNALFYSLPSSQINRLQCIQNALARAVTMTPKFHHITPALKSLHWLKIRERIKYKLISLTSKIIHTHEPSYLSKMIHIQNNSWSTRSSQSLTLTRPEITSSSKICNRSFTYAAPQIWNSLPPSLRNLALHSPTTDQSNTFHRALKTYLFNESFPT